ncbi:type ISP restriction/modification enzyme [Nocardioides sp. CER19]|uniref:DEAD/DEAH box helicase n=1 Tax=Nocardioides sp. CER19 TaxID=3038538 RepID=UPI0024472763|nr:type ISP restriction/modification enzyme [Nocardioides sp. CER19]MDH2415806.1 DEAD/DEAH box helicase family protein [Nocardioides sp. CER19]
MSVTIYEVLGDLRAQALDERDKGDKFERLIKTYLLNDPEWAARFSDVWLWTEWEGRQGRPDTGIDLVAALRDEDGYAAVQCKFYAPGATVSKGDIDSFLSASGGKEFTRRYIFDTAKSWSPNATDTLAHQAVPVQRIDIAWLEESAFDWSQYSWATPEVLVSTGKKALRPHQQSALIDVFDGFRAQERGKLIMACGTGKTYTSLKIAEELVGPGGTVLFLVPSIQLLSQSLREWMANTEVEIRPFAVCSDVRVGRQTNTDDADISVIDLAEPATTDAPTLVARMNVGKHATERMTVVFSTYQSIDVIHQAQELGLTEFDLVICDEAHRTTGVTLAGGDESAFVKVHDDAYLAAQKRLYMTATPRVFGEEVKRKATEAEAILADMADETVYGPEFHRLGFGDAVEADLLTDYKVLVLAVDEEYVAENFQNAMATGGEIALGDAAKLIGCWNGLAKHYGTADQDAEGGNLKSMKTAVAFAKDIKASKTAAQSFPVLVDRALQDEHESGPTNRLRVEAAHVDGTMGIHERNTHLAWLKESTPDDVCRILTNARCLSEGVDVPALDAVMFLTPRGSQVDVVQSVGRVMRKAPGKELGYIILPIVVPSGIAPEEALKDNERYRVVWQVLQALRSHDDRFHAMINQIELNKRKTDRLVIDNVTPRPEVEFPGADADQQRQPESEQLSIDYAFDGFRDAMYARIVQKVGERRYWETWAKDVSDIAQAHITRINGLLANEDSNPAKEFAVFLDGLRGNLNDNITRDEAIEMLAQHLVTRPIFDALFSGYNFAANNPVAQTMELMLASLDEHNLDSENATLETFYASVRRRVEGVNNAEGKQRILIELYDKFFATAFKKTVDKLGIVYTPVEIVDFILKSADDVLRAEFGQGLTDEGVHILDGFTGTGTFMVRLLQSGLIESHDLARKYANELHANEILLLAYYIAAVNIETTYADLTGEPKDFPGLILTDTFQSWEPDDRPDLDVFPENNARLEALKKLPITVIVGNPPYSSGQDSANDNNANEKYPSLDEEIRNTYAERSTATNKNSLYDSYIRAIKWATLRIKDRGVIAFVTNGGFIDSNTADGLRTTLAEEFASIYIYNLRGNQRTAGEQSRKEGGKIFGGGSRATVAITVLVKDNAKAGEATIHYTDVGDYLTREQKLEKVSQAASVYGLASSAIVPDEHGDWLNQRRDDFGRFLALAGDGERVFSEFGPGVQTNRDAWVYNASSARLREHMTKAVESYGQALAGRRSDDPAAIKWSSSLDAKLARGERIELAKAEPRVVQYRPFEKTRLYSDVWWIHRPGVLRRTYPAAKTFNHGFYLTGTGSDRPFSLFASSVPVDLAFWGSSSGQFFARWRYERVAEPGMLDLTGGGNQTDGYQRFDNVRDEALKRFQAAYPDEAVTKDDIFFYTYGLLHSPSYRETYAADLKKLLPRIPMVRAFEAYVAAGRALSSLHLRYESVTPYPLEGLDTQPTGDAYDFFAVGGKKMSFGKPSAAQKAAGERSDRSVIHYNDRITLRGIPEDAYRYMLGSRSAIEWIIDRYYVKTDKASKIINDPNDWSREVGDPRYILDLLARVVTVSVETNKIVDALPPLDIIEGA